MEILEAHFNDWLIKHKYPNVNLVKRGFHVTLFIVALLKYANSYFSKSQNLRKWLDETLFAVV